MNILCTTDAYITDQVGGISKSIIPEIDGLVKLGHEVTVISRRQSNAPLSEKMNGYDLYRYPSPIKKSPLYRLYPFFTIINLPCLVSKLNKLYTFDIAYIHNPFQLVALAIFYSKLPRVYVYHSSSYREIEIDIIKGKYKKLTNLAKVANVFVKLTEKFALSTAKKIIVRSDFMMQDMLNTYPNIDIDKIVKIPLCIDVSKFLPLEKIGALRQNLLLPSGKKIFLTVRRLVARMGIENLIIAMSKVAEIHPDILLIIGGIGYLHQDLANLIESYKMSDRIKLVGFIAEEQLAMYYRSADLFILPTLTYEGFGLVTIEALASGTPVIATPIGASPEVLEDLGDLFLFKGCEIENLVEGICKWIENGFTDTTRQKCYDYCSNNFESMQVSSRIAEALSTTLK